MVFNRSQTTSGMAGRSPVPVSTTLLVESFSRWTSKLRPAVLLVLIGCARCLARMPGLSTCKRLPRVYIRTIAVFFTPSTQLRARHNPLERWPEPWVYSAKRCEVANISNIKKDKTKMHCRQNPLSSLCSKQVLQSHLFFVPPKNNV